MEKCVNSVGVNINTASKSLLSYVSGLNKKVIDKIVSRREEVGKYKNREEIKKLSGVTDKVYEQSIGFLRIVDGDEPLDRTPIHPESYKITRDLLTRLSLTEKDLGSDKLKQELEQINIEKIEKDIKVDKYTLKDIIDALISPERDPRDKMPKPLLRSDILHVSDLHIGDKLQGTVRNVVDFGIFIDIGLHNDGLAHISKLSNEYIKHPSDLFQVGDIVDCYVDDIKEDIEKVSLSLLPRV